ncbi:MAG: methionine adenosyltransferase [Firmicutes bacterium]|nr:methionine adenosyltransferase [Bacillota bacterium]
MKSILTSESVNIGHPDKTCDTIADAFLDEALRQDPNAQMAVECAIKDDHLFIYGEATTTAKINYANIACKILADIGYTNPFKTIEKISMQSPEINKATLGLNNACGKKLLSDAADVDEVKANDQGIVYGYATNETPEFMPLPIILAHKLMKRYEDFRKQYIASDKSPMPGAASRWFFADAKSQVSIEYKNNVSTKIHTVLVSVSHSEDIDDNALIYEIIKQNVVQPVLAEYKSLIKNDYSLIINPSGKFTIWGSHSDSGCVGRKIVVDTYGGIGRIGGGCFSSKNATKIDRSGAYYARYVAKNVVANGFCDRVEVSASYAIGLADPLKINIDTFGTHEGKMKDGKPVELNDIYHFVNDNFCFRPASIIKELDLLKPIYQPTACYGHFGRSEFPWEQIKAINKR